MKRRWMSIAVVIGACGKFAYEPDAAIQPSNDAGDVTDAVMPDSAPTAFDASCGNCNWNDCDVDGAATHWNLGWPCTNDTDCCSSHCFHGSCQRPSCVSDEGACASAFECCSGDCENGRCAALVWHCKSLGNACTKDDECCSRACSNNVCIQPSFCGQNGEVCTKGADCCGGICSRSPDAGFGQCSEPFSDLSGLVEGVLCAGPDAGTPPLCGGPCASRICDKWGPQNAFVCLPSSGCHSMGRLCIKNTDCCGGNAPNPIVTCNIDPLDAGVGVCSNPTGCKPNGDICRRTNQCNAADMCCSGNVLEAGTCHTDGTGVPRCSYPAEAGSCVLPGAACATSADCCNLAPCVPAGDAGLSCYPSVCVPSGGACTADADCCAGTACYLSGGTVTGTCRALVASPACSLYGQLCSSKNDCCEGVPCTSGRCAYP